MVERRKQRTAFLQCAQAVEAHGIKPLENIALFAMLGGVAMLFDKALYFLETGDDALFARRAAALLLRLRELSSSARSSSRSRSAHSAPRP